MRKEKKIKIKALLLELYQCGTWQQGREEVELESKAQSLRESVLRTQEEIRKGRKQCFPGRLTELHAHDPVQTAKEKYILLLKDNYSTYPLAWLKENLPF